MDLDLTHSNLGALEKLKEYTLESKLLACQHCRHNLICIEQKCGIRKNVD